MTTDFQRNVFGKAFQQLNLMKTFFQDDAPGNQAKKREGFCHLKSGKFPPSDARKFWTEWTWPINQNVEKIRTKIEREKTYCFHLRTGVTF